MIRNSSPRKPNTKLLGQTKNHVCTVFLFLKLRIRWMKTHHQRLETVDHGMVTADDLHGNGQTMQGTAAHGPLDPEVNWTR
eukprot:4131489-Amphidinium_carterae.2